MNAAGWRHWGVVVAAGRGRRFGGERPKVYQLLLDRCVLEWSLGALLRRSELDAVVVVLAAEDPYFEPLPLSSHPRLLRAVGGAERADSVLAGLAVVERLSLDPARTRVLVHDGARPCLRQDELDALLAEPDGHGALLALPMVDTVKRHTAGRVQATEDRAALARALTPQAFPLRPLMAALRDHPGATDEAAAMEAAGHRPRLVWGRASNLKVTVPEDLALARYWLERFASEGCP